MSNQLQVIQYLNSHYTGYNVSTGAVNTQTPSQSKAPNEDSDADISDFDDDPLW